MSESFFSSAALELNSARKAARLGRAGVNDPFENFYSLASRISAATGGWQGRMRDADPVELAQFCREAAMSFGQLAELSQEIECLPVTSTTLLTPAESLRYVDELVRSVQMTYEAFSGGFDEYLMCELHAVLLSCEYHSYIRAERLGVPDVDGRRGRLAATLGAVEGELAELNPSLDDREVIPWIRGSIDRSKRAMAPSAFAPSIGSILALKDRDVAWDHSLAHLTYAAAMIEKNDDWKAAVGNFCTVVHEFVSRPAQDLNGYRAMANDPVLGLAGRLIDADELNGAWDLLDCLSTLAGVVDSGEKRLRTFTVGARVYAVLRDQDHLRSIQVDVPERDFLNFARAQEIGSPEEIFAARKRLNSAVREITSHPSLRGDSLYFEPFGLAAWWPWHVFSTGAGDTFGVASGMRWMAADADSRSALNSERILLVVDVSMAQSTAVVKHCRGVYEDRLDCVEFDSTNQNAGLKQDISERLADVAAFIYYGHGSSAPLRSGGSGLHLGEGNLWAASEILQLDMSHLEWALVVACESGRSNVVLQGLSAGHAMAEAGVSVVISTLWTILRSDGLIYLKSFLGSKKKSVFAAEEAISTWVKDMAPTPSSSPFFLISRPR